ncbi:hypothetical protein LCGC14_2371810, partial [marine sediment metagenome]
MARRPEDRYTNLAAISVVEVAAGTINFSELLTGISLGQGTGILIDQIDYEIGTGHTELPIGAGDEIHFGWATVNSLTATVITDRRILHHMKLTMSAIIGTPAS